MAINADRTHKARHRDPNPTGPRRPLETSEWLPFAIFAPVLIAIMVGAYLLADRLINDPWGPAQWETRTDTVASALNERYVENIQMHRERTRSRKVEIFVIDGQMRDDCTVKDDRHPALTCVGPLRLHEER